MGCEPIPGGGFICNRGMRRRRCKVPGCTSTATKLCDWPLTGRAAGRTCDADLCPGHATSVGKDRDYCPTHAKAREARKVTVCAECKRASCWQGTYLCERARGADVVEITIGELLRMGLESPSYWGQP